MNAWNFWVNCDLKDKMGKQKVLLAIVSTKIKVAKRKSLPLCRYLALEYAQSGQIIEKADVYSFGVFLVELVTGRKAVDIKPAQRPAAPD